MIKFIDLFSGIGGFRLGFESIGANCVFSCDNDPHANETYQKNFGINPFCDITTLQSSDIPDHDILCAGFPCQSFSIGGYRKGFNDSRGILFFDIARIIKDKKPKAFLLENVQGILTQDKGQTIETIRTILDELGYNTFESCEQCTNYGLPQNRKRWFCVGFRRDLSINNFKFPPKNNLSIGVSDMLEDNVTGHEPTDTAWSHIQKHYKNYKTTHSLDNYLKTEKQKITLAWEIRPSKCGIRDNNISPCLTAKMGTGGNNVPVIIELKRKFTTRECLRLMGFPDSFQIKENSYQSYKQIGNSVPVPMIKQIGKIMLTHIQ